MTEVQSDSITTNAPVCCGKPIGDHDQQLLAYHHYWYIHLQRIPECLNCVATTNAPDEAPVYRSPLETLLIDAVILLLERHNLEAYKKWPPADYRELQRIMVALHVERGDA